TMETHANNSGGALNNIVGIILVGMAGVLVWQLASYLLFVIPSPKESLRSYNRILRVLPHAAGATFRNAGIGFVLAVTSGAILGVTIGRSEYWYQVFSPIIVVGAATPKIIIYPILLLLLGLG